MVIFKFLKNYKSNLGYTTFGILGLISFIALLALIVFPKVSSFKAKGQQSEARIKLVKVYNSLYAYRLENGSFIDTQQKIVYLEDLKELDPYFKEDFYKKSNKNDKVFLISTPDKFAAAYVRVLSNGEFDIQRINSKKQFCYMLNGLEERKVNCDESQNYFEKSKSDQVKYAQKLKILEND